MKYVLVTGACGGMGRGIVGELVKRGYYVFAIDRRVGKFDGNVKSIVADITDAESLASAFKEIREVTDELYAIMHFAGVYMLDSLVEMSEESFERIFKINLGGVFLVNKFFMPLLKKESRVLIVTSELAPLDPLPFTGIYAVSKSALDKYAYALKMELQLIGIYVSVLRVGATNTEMLGASMTSLERFTEKTELYSCNAKRFRKIVQSVEARNISTATLANTAVGIIEKKRPKFIYNKNRNLLLLLLNALPKSLQLWIIKIILKA